MSLDLMGVGRWGAPLAAKDIIGRIRHNFALFTNGLVRVTDGVVGVEIPFQFEGVKEAAVQAKNLFMLLRDREKVSLSLSEKRMIVKSGSFRGQLPLGIFEEVAAMWPTTAMPKLRPMDEKVWKAVRLAYGAVPTASVVKAGLRCVAVLEDRVYSADGILAAVVPLPAKGKEKMSVPAWLIAYMEKTGGDPPTHWGLDEGRMWLRFPDKVTVWSRLSTEAWPEGVGKALDAMFKTPGTKAVASWKHADMRDALNNVLPFSSDRMVIRSTKSQIILSAESEHGSGEAAVPAKIQSQFEVALAPSVAKSILSDGESCRLSPDKHAFVVSRKGVDVLAMTLVT